MQNICCYLILFPSGLFLWLRLQKKSFPALPGLSFTFKRSGDNIRLQYISGTGYLTRFWLHCCPAPPAPCSKPCFCNLHVVFQITQRCRRELWLIAKQATGRQCWVLMPASTVSVLLTVSKQHYTSETCHFSFLRNNFEVSRYCCLGLFRTPPKLQNLQSKL